MPPSGRQPTTRPVRATIAVHSAAVSRSASDAADEHRRPPHRQRAEAVDDAGGEVGAEPDRGAHRRGGQVQREQPGDGEVGVAAAAGEDDAGAEHVDEQQREQHRLDGDVRELQRLAARCARGCGRSGRSALRSRSPSRERQRGEFVADRAQRVGSCGHGLQLGSRATGSARRVSAVAWPVSAKNTSSSDGWWTSTSSTVTPASSSARTTVGGEAGAVRRPEPAGGGRRG